MLKNRIRKIEQYQNQSKRYIPIAYFGDKGSESEIDYGGKTYSNLQVLEDELKAQHGDSFSLILMPYKVLNN